MRLARQKQCPECPWDLPLSNVHLLFDSSGPLDLNLPFVNTQFNEVIQDQYKARSNPTII